MRILSWLSLLIYCAPVYGQNVGIGTTAPVARLHVADSNVLFSGPLQVDPFTGFNTPGQGSGVRMFWYPPKAAFRAGYVANDNWSKANVGIYSFSGGNNNKASGENSTAFGNGNTASGNSSFVIGQGNTASASLSVAGGFISTASGEYAMALGYGCIASGNNSFAFGSNMEARALGGVALGLYGNNSDNPFQATAAPTDRIFQIGNGSAHLSRSNAITILRNGNAGLGITDPGFPLNFSTGNGDKISLSGTSGAHYGLGVQTALLQIHSNAAASDIAFGYGSSSSFTERARIVNTGEYGLQLTGRVQLRNGGSTPGIWLNNAANSGSPAFVGLANESLVGFFGNSPAGWALTMHTTTGNIGIGLNGTSPSRPLSFPAVLGEKILLYPGGNGEVGIGVYGNELRLHCDNPGSKVSFGTQDNAGVFTENAKAERNGAYAFSIFGSLWANGVTYASDERFKRSIGSIQSPLEKLLRIRGVEYEMQTSGNERYHFSTGRQIGLLAQNVEQVVPEAVQEMDGYKGVDYARLVPLLIEAIREQEQRIRELESRLVAPARP